MRNGGVHVLPVFQGHRNWIRVRYINPSNGRLDLLSLRAIALHGIYESNFIIIVIDNKLFDNNNDMFV